MSQPIASPTSRMPIRYQLTLGLGSAGILWLLLNLDTSPATRECISLYRTARTAADSLSVDQTFPRSANQNAQPRTCGFVRTKARWQ
ncbi:MAG: hypothetical protein ABJD11_12040 [Gemmatimonadota bacterium]